MIINGIICHLIKNCNGRLEVIIDDTKTDEYIGFDQHEPLAYALYKTLEKYFKHRKESHGDEDEKNNYNMDCQNNLQADLAEVSTNLTVKKHTNRKSKKEKQIITNGT